MKRHIVYPKIVQFRNVVTTINKITNYVGLDDNGEAIYDKSIKKPVLTFTGTVKLHGTNASVCFNDKDGFWYQSRKNIITVENDNAGFVAFAESNTSTFVKLKDKIVDKYKIDTSEFTISIYGEWAGKGIQKSVAINELDPALYIFGVKISNPNDPEFSSCWLDSADLRDTENRVFNVLDYKTYTIDVDFNMPELVQNKFAEITEQVEKECPIAKAFGIENGVGEGVVWTVKYKENNYRFKVKGEKHSVTKVKKLVQVDVEKLNSIKEFVNYAVTQNRFDQAIENVFNGEEIDIQKMGDLLRWMVKDIASEEMDTMTSNNLEPKDVNKYISLKTKEMFFEALKKF